MAISNKLTLSPDVDNRLAEFRELLLSANKKLNLVSRRDVNKLLPVLIAESLLPLEWDDCRLESPLLDIGSGGGFPGIPLKVVRPDLDLLLLDSNRKKTLFLRMAIEKLKLENAAVVWSRAEEFVDLSSNRGRFGTVMARGVGALASLLVWSAALLRPNGELIVWTSILPDPLPAAAGWFAPPETMSAAPGLLLVRFQRNAGQTT